MTSKLAIIVAGLGLSTVTSTSSAHHSFAAQFDAEKTIKVTGTITRVEWQNPHVWFYVDVADDDGDVTSWGMELASPNLLMRNGWTRSTMKEGDVVEIEGYLARDGSSTGNAQSIVIAATGKNLFTGSSFGSTQ
jgi:DNA/RNA endonuclease YhcR with UshA esterase domain